MSTRRSGNAATLPAVPERDKSVFYGGLHVGNPPGPGAFLVRPQVSLGMDDLSLGPRGRLPAADRAALARHVPGGAQRGSRGSSRAVQEAPARGVGPGQGL